MMVYVVGTAYGNIQDDISNIGQRFNAVTGLTSGRVCVQICAGK